MIAFGGLTKSWLPISLRKNIDFKSPRTSEYMKEPSMKGQEFTYSNFSWGMMLRNQNMTTTQKKMAALSLMRLKRTIRKP